MPARGAFIGVGIGPPGRPAQYSTPVFGGVEPRAPGAGGSDWMSGRAGSAAATCCEGGGELGGTGSAGAGAGEDAGATLREEPRASATVIGREEGAASTGADCSATALATAVAVGVGAGAASTTAAALEGAAGGATTFFEDLRSDFGAAGTASGTS